ncbi:MAG: nitroreductase [Gammaproteobacteria bacterium]|nr:MAG: nitroreductase [Gammaproteobacteria bacterium]
MNESLKHLNRSSTPAKALAEPAPDEAQLKQIIEVALTAPDHGRLRPYRFISIRGDARYRLSEIFVQATRQREPDVDAAYLAKQREKPLRSPLIVVVVAKLIESEKIPEIEQMLAAGAAAHNVLLASNALGFGSIWLTGANAYDDYVRGELGIADDERIVGFVYLGTSEINIPPRPLPDADEFLSRWE